jgi:hypothetical protein
MMDTRNTAYWMQEVRHPRGAPCVETRIGKNYAPLELGNEAMLGSWSRTTEAQSSSKGRVFDLVAELGAAERRGRPLI